MLMWRGEVVHQLGAGTIGEPGESEGQETLGKAPRRLCSVQGTVNLLGEYQLRGV